MKIFKFLLIILISFVPLFSDSSKLTERQKIDFILKKLETSEVKFIRNGTEYSGKEAKSHMERKLDYAGNKIKTAEQFIDYLGTKSSMTGKHYFVVLKNGEKVKSSIWLREVLKQAK